MPSSVKSREIKLPPQSLRRGLFVASLDRDWSETPFLFQGFLIEADQEIEVLCKLCAWVRVDPVHSDPAAIRALGVAASVDPPAGANRARTPLPRRDLAAREAKITPRGQPVPWLRPAASRRKYDKRRRSVCPPFTPVAPHERSALVPADVQLVRYRDETPFEKEVEVADSAATLAQDALKTLTEDMARGLEPNLAHLRSSAEDLSLSIVRNPDALQWLVRMRDSNTAVYAHGVKVAVYLLSFARHLGFAPGELVQMATIGLLLDVGKIYVESELLQRAGPLSAEERLRMQEHVRVGLEAR